MSKKLTKKEQESFKKAVESILVDANFTHVEDTCIGGSRWELDSNVGKLHVSLWGYGKGSELHSILTRFDNPNLAKETWCFLCNPHSGKFNFHFTKKDKDEMMENFRYFIHVVTKDMGESWGQTND